MTDPSLPVHWVIAPGSRVFVGGDVPAVVLSVVVKGNGNIQYECAWWKGKERVSEWLESCELAPAAVREHCGIGFAASPYAPPAVPPDPASLDP